MTQPSRHVRRLPSSLLPLLFAMVLAPVQLTGCVSSSTDTGNPPFVKRGQIRVVASTLEDQVEVRGNAGSVPGGAEVEVTNVANDASQSGSAGRDGSFAVSITGTTEDEYRLVVTQDGESTDLTLGPGTPSVDAGAALPGRIFLLETAEGYTPVMGTTPSVNFSEAEFGFSAGCNGYSGEYTLCDGKLCVPGFGSSEIGCDPERSAQDDWFEDFFSSEPTLDLRGDEVTFTGSEATLVFLDREVANPDRSLTGPVWTVDTVIEGMGASNFSLSEPATLEFSDAGTVDVFSGCKDQVYSYEIDGDTLAFTFVSTTQEACSSAASELSAHVGEVLGDSVSFEIDAQRLTLTNGDVGLSATTD